MRFLPAFVFFAFFISSKWISSQTVIGNYYDAENQIWHLVEIRPTSGEVKEVGSLFGVNSITNLTSSFVLDGLQNKLYFFGYDYNNLFRFYTASSEDAEILSSPVVEEDGWYGLTLNPNDSILYVMRGVFDSLGTELVRFVNHEDGTYEHIQHLDLESHGPGAVTNGNIFVSQGYEYYTGTSNGNNYAVNTDLIDSSQSFNVLCDYVAPEYVIDLRYHPLKDGFFALMFDENYNLKFISIDPSTGQTELIKDLTGYELSNNGGGILLDSGYYIFTGTYTGDTIQRVFSVDIETGEVVNDPALSLQVQILSIDVDQNSLVGINELNESGNTISLYPNPASDVIRFEMNNNAEYQVVDVFGKVILKGISNGNKQVKVDVSDLAVGVYYLRVGVGGSASFVVAR